VQPPRRTQQQENNSVINASQLLADLARLLKRLEDDLRQRITDVADLKSSLQAEWQDARDADRTAETFETWADQVITQAGVHWLLSCVFLRFIEDNELVERPWLGGSPQSGRLALARDRHDAYFHEKPLESDRDYLLAAFREAGELPGLHTFFDEAHNPIFRIGLSGDAAMAVRQFWQQVDPNTGTLAHDFTDSDWNTRFLGDLYQDLSEVTRKRYALLQTPEFVEEFILDRSLTPAIREFGYREVRMIDPTCGSGHFLLGAFHRLVDEWVRHEPARNPRDIAQRALDAVAGVDINPFAVAISRFRLLVSALKVSGVRRLTQAPDFKLSVAIGDSLLHGKRFGLTATEGIFERAEDYAETGLAHAYATEDLKDLQRILGKQYHVVVGNPPYIVVREPALNQAYRNRYVSCHRQYSLGCPFTERFFELAVTGSVNGRLAGFVGLITTNSFMKREFGSKLIEEVLPRVDLTHVIDTSGAYIPGHGTPTVILLGRNSAPVSGAVRTVMGIKGEPSTPDDPAQGQVWTAIIKQVDHAGSESEFVSVADLPRAVFKRHPWSIGGGGAADLFEQLCDASNKKLGSLTTAIGRTTHTGEDGVFFVPPHWVRRNKLHSFCVPLIEGESVRDFALESGIDTIFPYDKSTAEVIRDLPQALARHFWLFRRTLKERSDFGKYIEERGLLWYEHSMFFPERFRTQFGIAFAFVAPHNHFVFDRGGKVFKQSAPVIKLAAGATESEHLELLGLLNSSIACFCMKQVSHQKQMVGGDGVRVSERSKVPYEFSSTQLEDFPLPRDWPIHPLRSRLGYLGKRADALARSLIDPSADEVIARGLVEKQPLPELWHETEFARDRARSRLIFIQEEIDFVCYHMYGLIDDSGLLSEAVDWDVTISAGSRPFCIASQKNVDGFDVPQVVPEDWPEILRNLWKRRITAINSNPLLRVIEEPHYKRRWIGRQGLFNHDAHIDAFRAALRTWLLDHLELPFLSHVNFDRSLRLKTTNQLADAVRGESSFMQIAELYAGHANFDPAQVVAELIASEAVPFLPVLHYTETGLRKRMQWEDTWALQRREDAGDKLSSFPAPPKYQSKDFLKSDYWRLRGNLDVPKERWISYPGCERGADGSLVIAWAGWDHLQQATALAGYYVEMKDNEGWEPIRLQPLLAGLLEVVPWLEQWHNEIDPVYGERMGAYYRGFVNEEARALGLTVDDLRAWKPAATAAKRGRKKIAQHS
jgi:hypothetical protein